MPSDPKVKEIFEKRPDMWKKIAKSVQEYSSKPINADRLAKAAGAAKREYPHKGAEFSHAERNFKKVKCP